MVDVTLSPWCRELRRDLGALGWMVFEDVVLDAELTDAGLRAATSARRVAAHLGITPGTAAVALRRLRQHGLVAHRRLAGAAGRFGLSVYEVVIPAGMTAVPCADPRDTVTPHVEDRVAAPPLAEQPARQATGRCRTAEASHQLSLIEQDGDE
jgi:hypothetical protein